MSKWGYFKIESEFKDKLKFDDGKIFDNTRSMIFKVEPEMYDTDFEKIVLEWGKAINTLNDFDDFLIWCQKVKKMNIDYAEFNFIENYTSLKKREENK